MPAQGTRLCKSRRAPSLSAPEHGARRRPTANGRELTRIKEGKWAGAVVQTPGAATTQFDFIQAARRGKSVSRRSRCGLRQLVAAFGEATRCQPRAPSIAPPKLRTHSRVAPASPETRVPRELPPDSHPVSAPSARRPGARRRLEDQPALPSRRRARKTVWRTLPNRVATWCRQCRGSRDCRGSSGRWGLGGG